VNGYRAHVLLPAISDYEGETTAEYHFSLDILGYPTQTATGDPFWGHGCALTVRRDVFTSLGGSDDDYFIFYEETDFCWRAQITAHVIFGVREAVVLHFAGGTVGDGSVVNGRIVTSANRRCLSERNGLSDLLKNYNIKMLIESLAIYTVKTMTAILALAVTRQWSLVKAYVRPMIWHIRNIQRTRRKRKLVQCLRTRDDLFVVRRMYRSLRELELVAAYGIPRTHR
jgi:GT2 family glycosyltransferase